MMIKRLKRPRMGLRTSSVVRCPGHLQWTRSNACVIAGHPGHVCTVGRSHAHHVQSWRAIEGGMGMKVGDDKVVPLCAKAHDLVHDGQERFEKAWDVDLEEKANANWRDSPHRIKHEQKQQQYQARLMPLGG